MINALKNQLNPDEKTASNQKNSQSSQMPKVGRAYIQGGALKIDAKKASATTKIQSPKTALQKKSGHYAEQYYRRAEALVEKNNFAMAVLELRDALKLDPQNSACHSLLGDVYLKQKQRSMARIHFERALALNPKDEVALKGRQLIGGKPRSAGQKRHPSSTRRSSRSGQDKPENGFLGNWFGRRKQ